jgi:hypothetical protein
MSLSHFLFLSLSLIRNVNAVNTTSMHYEKEYMERCEDMVIIKL